MSKLPSTISTTYEASIPSPSLVIVKLPFSIYTKPFSSSSVFSLCMPSLSAVRSNVPPAILTLSFPDKACFPASTTYSPLVMTKSSFDTIPCPFSHVTSRLPAPLRVKSLLEKIAASILLSSIASNSPLVHTVFVEPSVVVIKTLSASFTYIAADVSQLMSALSSTSCTLAFSASTTICPFVRLPDKI